MQAFIKYIILSLFFSSVSSWAQSRMDLDDLQIRGELHDDQRFRMLARHQNELENYVKLRTDYRSEIVEGLPKPKPRLNYNNKQ